MMIGGLVTGVVRRFAVACSALALLLAVSPAAAQESADKALQLDFVSDQNVEAGSFLTVPEGFPDARELRLGVEFDAGVQSFQFYGNYQATPAGTPFVGVLFGLTTLDPTQSVKAGTDPSTLHLVLGLDSDFSLSVIGREFETAFADFAGSYDGGEAFPGFYPNGVTESDFIDQLLADARLSGQYGRSSYSTNLLFDFGSYLAQNGGALSDRHGITLVAFSAGQGIGAGTVQAFDVPVSGVPEPAGWALMIMGFGAVGSVMRRRARGTANVSVA